MDELKKLDQQLNEIWERVQAAGTAPSAGESLDLRLAERDFMEESLRRLRRRYDQERLNWNRLFEERDHALAALRDEKVRLEAEAARLRQRLAELESETEAQLELQALEKSEREGDLLRQIQRHQSEVSLYEEQIRQAEESRRRETERYEESFRRLQEKERSAYRLIEKREAEIADLKAKLGESEARRRQEQAAARDEAARREASLAGERAEAGKERRSFQETLETRKAEMQNFERLLRLAQEEAAGLAQERQELERRLRISEERAGRLQQDLASMREAWEAERAQWRELWERERSGREKWQEDMRSWELDLRRERETWLQQFQAEQQSRAQAAQKVERNMDRLREVIWSLPVFRRRLPWSRRASGLGLPSARAWAVLAVAAALAAAAALVFPRGPASYPSPTPHASGLAVRGDSLWFADWMSGQVLQAAARRPSEIRFPGTPSADVHPVTVRWAQDRLWSLDAWGRRLQEHMPVPPFAVLRGWPLASPSPADFAWDGQGFWVLDSSDQVLRRYPPDDFQAPDRQAVLPSDWRLTALDCVDGEFWGYDAAAHSLRRFRLSPQPQPSAEYRLPVHARAESPLTGLSVSRAAVWTLSEKSNTVYRWPRRGLHRR